MKLKIFLVGGFGFIGKNFVKKYSKEFDIICFGKKNGYDDLFNKGLFSKTTLEFGDVTENVEEKIIKHNPDFVIHAAALTGLLKCNNDLMNAFKINVIGTINVINGCLKSNSRLIFLSSREVYGETINLKTSELEIPKPNNVYGTTKMIGEDSIILAHKKFGLSYTILRLTNVYGPEGDNYGAQIIIKNALKSKIEIWGGKQKINYIFIEDVIDAIYKVIFNKISINEIYNIGTVDNITVEEFCDFVLKHIERCISVEKKPLRKNETMFFIPDIEKARKDLKFEAKVKIDEGIKNTIKWYSEGEN